MADKSGNKGSKAPKDLESLKRLLNASVDALDIDSLINSIPLERYSQGTFSRPRHHNIFTPRIGGEAETEADLAAAFLRTQLSPDAPQSAAGRPSRPSMFRLVSAGDSNNPRTMSVGLSAHTTSMPKNNPSDHVPQMPPQPKRFELAPRKRSPVVKTATSLDLVRLEDPSEAYAWNESLCWLWIDTTNQTRSTSISQHFAQYGVTSFRGYTNAGAQNREGLWMYIPAVWCDWIMEYLDRDEDVTTIIDTFESWMTAVSIASSLLPHERARQIALIGFLNDELLAAFGHYIVFCDTVKRVVETIRWRLKSQPAVEHLQQLQGVQLVQFYEQANDVEQSADAPGSGQREQSFNGTLSTIPQARNTKNTPTRKRTRKGKGKGDPDGDSEGSSTDDDGDDDRKPKRRLFPRLNPRYACPFFRNKPLAYIESKACAGDGFLDIDKMKEHLKRRHMQPKYCRRCHSVFKCEDDIEIHSKALVPCSPSSNPVPEGIDEEQWERLKKRRPAGMSEADHWDRIYHILFPADGTSRSPYVLSKDQNRIKELMQLKKGLVENLEARITRALLPARLADPRDDYRFKRTAIRKLVQDAADEVFQQHCFDTTETESSRSSADRQSAELDKQHLNFPALLGPGPLQVFPSVDEIVDDAFEHTEGQICDLLYLDAVGSTPAWDMQFLQGLRKVEDGELDSDLMLAFLDPEALVAS